ncbi:MAG: CRTAC1 family protein [Acidobacteria bacterium]|nr:CRTAC1 family protein [Acidobacteriota bacterium]
MTVLVALVVAGCAGDSNRAGSPVNHKPTRAAPAQDEWFTDRAEETGLDFVHFNGATGQFLYPEILPPGVALFDYDNDGDLDVYVVQGRMLASEADPRTALPPSRGALRRGHADAFAEAGIPPRDSKPLTGRLFRNDLQVRADGTRVLHFTDVTEQSGINARQYGLGVAAADVDNDGWVDLLLTNFGTNQLFHNNGDGTFTDISNRSGIQSEPGVAVSAAFLDYDRDGWLDLYVGYNVNYTLKNDRFCPNMAGARDYCPPQIFGGRADRLYRNLGNGKFVDVSAKALVGGKFGPALGVVTADFNGDGWIDIYVANNGEPNLLWINQRDGTFRETALLAGVALTAEGKAEASMGVDAGDFDGDGDEDLVMTELTGQGANLYVNDGSGRFRDASAASSLGPLSLPFTGWGTAWFDFDNDGWLDLLIVNGTIVANEGRTNQPFPYDQRKALFRNLGDGRFENVTDRAGAAFTLSESGRGAAFGDIDNDGDVDVVVGNDGGRLRLLVNNIGNRNHWLGLRAVGKQGRDMLGATVAVIRGDGSKLWRRVHSDGSYGSANDPRVLVGLGRAAENVKVRVQWPSGRAEEWPDVAVDRWITLKEGSGR